jgi:hypothetical protein
MVLAFLNSIRLWHPLYLPDLALLLPAPRGAGSRASWLSSSHPGDLDEGVGGPGGYTTDVRSVSKSLIIILFFSGGHLGYREHM